jgi:L-ribulose-5-phosphate 3-epimerase
MTSKLENRRDAACRVSVVAPDRDGACPVSTGQRSYNLEKGAGSGLSRRGFIAAAGTAAAGTLIAADTPAGSAVAAGRNRIAVSTYSMWQFRHDAYRDPLHCLDLAAKLGFAGIEFLRRQLPKLDRDYLLMLKREAYARGLAVVGYSTHQDFVDPAPEVRAKNIAETGLQLEEAQAMGIPSLRVNTGRWDTSGSFDALMARKGIEDPLPGHTDEEAFGWVIAALRELVAKAASTGVLLGLENHWGLARTADGLLRILGAVASPWLRATLDTGNFLDDAYAQMDRVAPHAVLVQAKTYFGGGRWYTLDLDYARIAELLAKAGYRGFISLEFEGNAPVEDGLQRSLDLLRTHFG